MTKRKRSTSQTLGGIIVGFDQQVFRTTPPAHELVEHAKPVRGISGADGTDFLIVTPTDEAAPTTTPEPGPVDLADPADAADPVEPTTSGED